MKKIFVLLLMIIVVLSGCSEPSPFRDVEVGNLIEFGSYEQDNDKSNGAEPIEWLVLDKTDNKILVISKYGLDCQPYNIERIDVTWETCSLRKWLNSTFMHEAFTSHEQSQILMTTVTADENRMFDTNPGNDTEDKIFLFSIDEIVQYLSSNRDTIVKATSYTKQQGAWISPSGEFSGNSVWWLRSPGYNRSAAIVSFDGQINYGGSRFDYNRVVVRPVMWLSIE